MHVPLLMPDLDWPPQQAIAVSCRLILLGREDLEGDRLPEVSAGEVLWTFPLRQRATVQKSVAEGDLVVANRFWA